VVAVLTGAEAARHCATWRGILLHYHEMKSGAQLPLKLDRVRTVDEPVVAVAAHLLEANPDDLELADGRVHVKGSPARCPALGDVARTVCLPWHTLPPGLEPSLEATNHYTNPIAWAFTNGAHLAAVDLDVDRGEVRLVEYAVLEDCGRIINPAVVDGQVRGGVVQRIGGAPYEQCVYDGTG
jgi:carbon-monoxide dehydrogenase large subunit